MKIPALLISFFASLFLLHGGAHGADWPFFRGPERNGVAGTASLEPLDEPERIWKINLGSGDNKGGVVLADGRLYGPSNAQPNSLVCLDAKSGEKLWTHPTGKSDSTPSVQTGCVYHLDDNRTARCLDAKSGELIWKSEPLPAPAKRQGWRHTGSPLLWEDLIIVNVGYGAAVKIDSGELVWHHDGQSGLAAPVLFSHAGKPAVAVFAGDAMVASDARTGAVLWSIPWKTNESVNASDPIFFDDGNKLFVSSNYGLGRALYDLSSGEPKEIWNRTDDGAAAAFSSAIYHQDQLLVFTNHGFGRIDLENGNWLYGVGGAGDSVLVFGQHLLTMTQNGEVIVFDLKPDKLEEIHRAQVASKTVWNIPAYADGNLYVRNGIGDIFCVRISM